MAYEFQEIYFSLFDFHLMLDPLVNAAAINNNYTFLVDPTGYNQHYSSGASVHTGDLKLSPLRWRALTFHHYWKFYQTIWTAGGSSDFWKLQMPFLGTFDQTKINLNTGSTKFQGTAEATIFVTGMGWSTNLDIQLTGKMTPADVLGFVSRLPKMGGSFIVDGDPKTLPEAFGFGRRCQRMQAAPRGRMGMTVHLTHTTRQAVRVLRSFLAILIGLILLSLVTEAIELAIVTALNGSFTQDQTVYFSIRNRPAVLVAKLAYNTGAAFLAGYVAAWVAVRAALWHGAILAIIQSALFIWGMAFSQYAGTTPTWAWLSLTPLMCAGIVLGASLNATRRNPA